MKQTYILLTFVVLVSLVCRLNATYTISCPAITYYIGTNQTIFQDVVVGGSTTGNVKVTLNWNPALEGFYGITTGLWNCAEPSGLGSLCIGLGVNAGLNASITFFDPGDLGVQYNFTATPTATQLNSFFLAFVYYSTVATTGSTSSLEDSLPGATCSTTANFKFVPLPPTVTFQPAIITYVEGTASPLIMQNAIVNGQIDQNIANGGFINVAFSASIFPGQTDALTPVNTANITYLSLSTTGVSSSVQINGVNSLSVQFTASANTINYNNINNNISLSEASLILASIQFSNNNTNPTPFPRFINVTIDNGASPSLTNTSQLELFIQLVDQPPVINLNTTFITYIQQQNSPLLVFPEISVFDPDGPFYAYTNGFLTISFTSGYLPAYDTLIVSNTTNITVSGNNLSFFGNFFGTYNFNSTTGVFTSLFVNSNAGSNSTQSLLGAISFIGLNPTPTTSGNPKVLTVIANDGKNSSIPVNVTIFTIATNVPPVLNFSINPQSVTYLKKQNYILLTANNTINITDFDEFGQFGPITITVSYNVSFPTDQLSIVSSGSVGLSGSNVTLSGTPIGTISLISNGIGTNPLVITLAQGTTLATTASVLSALGYISNDLIMNPDEINFPAVPRILSITVDNGGNNTAPNRSLSAPVFVNLNVIAINFPPVVNFSASVFNPFNYLKHSGPKPLFTGVTVTDLDANDFNGGYFFISITSIDSLISDSLTFTSASGLSYNNGSNTFFINTTPIGTVVSTQTSFNVSFINLAVNVTIVSSILSGINYNFFGYLEPNNERIVTVVASDGKGGLNPGTYSFNITVQNQNLAPILLPYSGPSFQTWSYGNSPIQLLNGFAVAEDDVTDYNGGSIVVSGISNPQDSFSIANINGITTSGSSPIIININSVQIATANTNGNSFVITFTSNSTIQPSTTSNDDVSTVLNAIQYTHIDYVNATDLLLTRSFTFELIDAAGLTTYNSSTSFTVNVVFAPIPVITSISNDNGDYYTQGDPAIQLFPPASGVPNITINSTNIALLNNYIPMRFKKISGQADIDMLYLNGNVSYNSNTNNVTYDGDVIAVVDSTYNGVGINDLLITVLPTATLEAINAILESVYFTITGYPLQIARIIQFQYAGAFFPSPITITITAINEPTIVGYSGPTSSFSYQIDSPPVAEAIYEPNTITATNANTDFSVTFASANITIYLTNNNSLSWLETLEIISVGAISVSSSNIISYQGNQLGSYTHPGNYGIIVVTFNPVNIVLNASMIGWIINCISYQNSLTSSEIPSDFQQSVNITIFNGNPPPVDTQYPQGTSSTPITRAITIAKPQSPSLNIPLIVGASVGGAVGLGLIIAAIFFTVRNYKKKSDPNSAPATEATSSKRGTPVDRY